MGISVLIIAKLKHNCRACGRGIAPGSKAVRMIGVHFIDYFHERCWSSHYEDEVLAISQINIAE